MRIPKYQLTNVRIFFIIWGVFLLGLLVLGTLYTLNRIKNESNLNKALIENVGKPIIYETHYFSPGK